MKFQYSPNTLPSFENLDFIQLNAFEYETASHAMSEDLARLQMMRDSGLFAHSPWTLLRSIHHRAFARELQLDPRLSIANALHKAVQSKANAVDFVGSEAAIIVEAIANLSSAPSDTCDDGLILSAHEIIDTLLQPE